ncbi:MAG: zinc transporter ZupT [Defluviitaleaceae bacterium]|nr:zinc transporter ZupT [Defluviitaleaceae bacterium]
MNDITFAFLLTIIAGTATGVGGLAILFSKKTSKKFLSICLSLSAGVMLYISFGEILPEAFEDLGYAIGDGAGYLVATVAFFVGILIVAAIDKIIPHNDEIAEITDYTVQDSDVALIEKDKKELKRTGVMAAIAIAIHNLPEGIVIFMAALHDPTLGIAIALAIILHNIPEGIATAAPIYYSTGNKLKAFLFAFCTGYVQVIGALIAWLLVGNIFDDIEAIFGIVFAIVAGIMVYVAIHQLLPAAQRFGKHHMVMKWLFTGMAIMAVSLVALEFIF